MASPSAETTRASRAPQSLSVAAATSPKRFRTLSSLTVAANPFRAVSHFGSCVPITVNMLSCLPVNENTSSVTRYIPVFGSPFLPRMPGTSRGSATTTNFVKGRETR